MTLTPIQSVYAAEMTSVIKINEVESNVLASNDTTEDEKANASNDKKDNDKETTESPKTGDTANV